VVACRSQGLSRSVWRSEMMPSAGRVLGVVQREELHDHLEGFTRFIRLHKGHSYRIVPGQRLPPRERNGPAGPGQPSPRRGSAFSVIRRARRAVIASSDNLPSQRIQDVHAGFLQLVLQRFDAMLGGVSRFTLRNPDKPQEVTSPRSVSHDATLGSRGCGHETSRCS
jgi:hypothetical protein